MKPRICAKRWVPVPFFDAYEVSDHGDVLRVECESEHGGYRPRVYKARMLSLGNSKYPTVTLWGNHGCQKVRVHSLVADAFVPDRGNYSMVRHLDDNGWNNHYSNLAWGGHKLNSEDRVRLGTTGKTITAQDAAFIKARLAQGIRGEGVLLARHYEVSPALISAIGKGKVWAHV